MKKVFALCALCFGLSALGACSMQTIDRGYVFPKDLDAEIAGIKTTAQLEDKLGSPQAKTMYGAPVWVYYSAEENYHGPFPLTWDDRAVVLAWVNGSQVTKTKVLRGGELPDVSVDGDETPIPAAIELNALEELFNNVGRFSPTGLGQ